MEKYNFSSHVIVTLGDILQIKTDATNKPKNHRQFNEQFLFATLCSIIHQ